MREVSKEKKEFIMDLQEFAENWIDEVNNVILEHIDELFEDATIRFLVKRYAEEKRKNKEFNKHYLLSAYEHEHEVIKHRSISNFGDALYELCYKRYDKGDDK